MKQLDEIPFEDIPPIRQEAEGLFLIGACSFCAGALFALLCMALAA